MVRTFFYSLQRFFSFHSTAQLGFIFSFLEQKSRRLSQLKRRHGARKFEGHYKKKWKIKHIGIFERPIFVNVFFFGHVTSFQSVTLTNERVIVHPLENLLAYDRNTWYIRGISFFLFYALSKGTDVDDNELFSVNRLTQK